MKVPIDLAFLTGNACSRKTVLCAWCSYKLENNHRNLSRPGRSCRYSSPDTMTISKLLLLACLSPVGNAVVERLFSLMKITKTLLRNRLSDRRLDILLRLNKEAPVKWTEEQAEELVELWERQKSQRR